MTVFRKPGFGLFFWSANRGCWCVQFVSDDRSRLEAIRERFSLFHGLQYLHPTIVEALSDDDADIALAGSLLDPPPLAFVDPAPDGVIDSASPFDELLGGLMLEAEYSAFRSEAWWKSAGNMPEDVILRSLFAHRALLGVEVSDALAPSYRG